MPYELKTEKFKGPLDKLLELIEERKLEITEISLATVTDYFLKYLEGLTEISPGILADFLVVASRLVLIKSKSLLPELSLTEEEEADVKDLERRLRLYKEFKAAERHIAALWRKGSRSYGRQYFFHISNLPPVFYPGRSVTLESLREAIERTHESVQKFVLETETVPAVIVSLEEKMQEVVRRMEAVVETSLHTMHGGRSRTELVVLFLAILHLAREQLVTLEQEDRFSDIIIKKSVERS